MRKNVTFCKNVALVRCIFPEILYKISPILFSDKNTKNRVLSGGKNVTFCQKCRSYTGGFY